MRQWISDHDGALFLGGIVLLAIFGLGTLIGVSNNADKRVAEREIRQDRYLADHKCVTVSFAGKDAQPVYQCDNGLVMRKQIP